MTSCSEIEAASAETAVAAKSVCFVVASPLTLKFFFVDQIAALGRAYRMTCAANCPDPDWLRQRGIDAPLLNVPIERNPSPLRDLRALWLLYRRFRSQHFEVVHSNTPKAGLLAMIAAAAAHVPVRIHTFTGQVWANRGGIARTLLKALDRIIAGMATHILVDSRSQQDFLRREGVVTGAKSRVLGHGSVSGVDLERFRPNQRARQQIRGTQVTPASAVVFLYLGRLKRDKGVLDLAQAFSQLARENQNTWLYFVGPDEDGLESRIRGVCEDCAARIRFHNYTDSPESWLAACDVLCLPSYREGFGSTIIEAAAVGVPSLASRIYGITDAVEDGLTGLLHEPGDTVGMARDMRILAEDPSLRASLGRGARHRAHRYFSKNMMTAELLDFYAFVLGRSNGAASEAPAHASED